MRARFLSVLVTGLAALTLSACGAEDEAVDDTAATSKTIEVNFSEGSVDPEIDTVSVKVGTSVTLKVTSDVDEEVHVHGFNESVEVVAGEEAEHTFVADVPGVYEAEMEGSGVLAFELEVTP